jgi:hypothetical protein
MAKSERDDGRVLNPQTGNWVKKSYAKNIGVYREAKKATEEYFEDQVKEDASEEDIDEILDQIDTEDDMDFDITEDDFIDVDPPDMNEDDEEFEPKFSRPPTPPGMENMKPDSQRSQKKDGKRSGGIYTRGESGPQNSPYDRAKNSEIHKRKRRTNEKVKYIRTKTGGMKVVRPGDPDWEDA